MKVDTEKEYDISYGKIVIFLKSKVLTSLTGTKQIAETRRALTFCLLHIVYDISCECIRISHILYILYTYVVYPFMKHKRNGIGACKLP